MMTTSQSSTISLDKQRVDDILRAYFEAEDAGLPPELSELLKEHPDLSSALAKGLEDIAFVKGRLDAEKSLQVVKEFGDYLLLEQVGKGGMGVVYKATQQSLGRVVAVKLILEGRFASPEHVSRFHNEAKLAARLRHPHIVPIHEVGECEGQHFYSMDYVHGESLAEMIRRDPILSDQAAEIVRVISIAVHHAHCAGIVHRDLKPQNVLVDKEGVPHVTDFGLAKELTDAGDFTASQIAGTPHYMAPEQVTKRKVGPRTDVYSLGVILYQALVGNPPFRGSHRKDVYRQIVEDEPNPPHRVSTDVSRDLSTICVKCLEKEPSRRYETALDLADDLSRFLNSEPIKARPVRLPGIVAKWARRRPALATLSAALTVSFVVFGIGITLQWYEAVVAKERADANLAITLEALDFSSREIASIDLAHAPQMEQVRRKILEKDLAAYTALLERNRGDASLMLENGKALLRVGEIRSGFGEIDNAIRAYCDAISCFTELLQGTPDDDSRKGVVAAWNGLALLHNRRNEFEAALKAFQKAERGMRVLAVPSSDRLDYVTNIAILRNNQAANLLGLYRIGESIVLCQQTLDELQSLNEAENDVAYCNALSQTWMYLGNAHVRTSEHDEARSAYENATNVLEQVAMDHADDQHVISGLATAYRNLARSCRLVKKDGEAIANYKRSLRYFEKLTADYPSIVGYHHELAEVRKGLAFVLPVDDALPVMQRGVETRRHAAAMSGADPRGHQGLRNDLLVLAQLYVVNARYENVTPTLEEFFSLADRPVDHVAGIHEYIRCKQQVETDASLTQEQRRELAAEFLTVARRKLERATQRQSIKRDHLSDPAGPIQEAMADPEFRELVRAYFPAD